MASASPQSPANLLPPTGDSASPHWSGLRSFWKADKAAAASPSEHGSNASSGAERKDGSRLRRLLKRDIESKTPESEEAKTKPQKRREQIYQAQKRHRNRRAEYTKNLEDEVTRLRNMDSSTRQDKTSLENQNRIMKELLASHSIDAQLSSINLAAPAFSSTGTSPNTDLDMPDSATVCVRYDPDLKKERACLDWPSSDDMAWSSETTASTPDPPPKPPAAQGNSWVALDFILALEWPCKGHMVHAGINPHAEPHIECKLGEFTGHSLTTTAAVFESSVPSLTHSHQPRAENGDAQEKWLLPHSEIEKLVKLSENLPLDDEQMTPAQAYSAVRQHVESDQALRSTLELLKIPLGALVECAGYGSVLPSDQFWQHLETALTSLKC